MLCTLDKDPHIESFFGQCLRPCEGCAHRPTEYYDDIGVTWTVCLRWYNLLHPVQSLQHWVFLYVDASVYHYPCASCSVCYAGSKTLFFLSFRLSVRLSPEYGKRCTFWQQDNKSSKIYLFFGELANLTKLQTNSLYLVHIVERRRRKFFMPCNSQDVN